MAKCKHTQITDNAGNPIVTGSNQILITGSATTEIFTGVGVLLSLIIAKDCDGGTFYFTNTAGQAITGLPSSSAKGITDFPGTFKYDVEITAGLKVVTESATGLVMTVNSFN